MRAGGPPSGRPLAAFQCLLFPFPYVLCSGQNLDVNWFLSDETQIKRTHKTERKAKLIQQVKRQRGRPTVSDIPADIRVSRSCSSMVSGATAVVGHLPGVLGNRQPHAPVTSRQMTELQLSVLHRHFSRHLSRLTSTMQRNRHKSRPIPGIGPKSLSSPLRRRSTMRRFEV